MHIGLRRPLPSVYAHAMRIAFMGTPDFAVPTLDALVSAGHDVVAVYSQPPPPAGRGKAARHSPAHPRAGALGLPVHTPATLLAAQIRRASCRVRVSQNAS